MFMNAVLLPYFFNTIVHVSLSFCLILSKKISNYFEFVQNMFIGVVKETYVVMTLIPDNPDIFVWDAISFDNQQIKAFYFHHFERAYLGKP